MTCWKLWQQTFQQWVWSERRGAHRALVIHPHPHPASLSLWRMGRKRGEAAIAIHKSCRFLARRAARAYKQSRAR